MTNLKNSMVALAFCVGIGAIASKASAVSPDAAPHRITAVGSQNGVSFFSFEGFPGSECAWGRMYFDATSAGGEAGVTRFQALVTAAYLAGKSTKLIHYAQRAGTANAGTGNVPQCFASLVEI